MALTIQDLQQFREVVREVVKEEVDKALELKFVDFRIFIDETRLEFKKIQLRFDDIEQRFVDLEKRVGNLEHSVAELKSINIDSQNWHKELKELFMQSNITRQEFDVHEQRLDNLEDFAEVERKTQDRTLKVFGFLDSEWEIFKKQLTRAEQVLGIQDSLIA